jgi:predicted HAD superfamily Cof-like phosphohydrolase
MQSTLNKILVELQGMKLNDGRSLKSIFNDDELFEITLKLAPAIDKTNQELVTEFNDTFKAEKETTEIVDDFKFKELRIALILEECIELAFALGYDASKLYDLFLKLRTKVYSASPLLNNGEQLTEAFDAGIDLLVVVYGLFDIFNMAEAVPEGMKEVHKSNMSKLCNNKLELEQTVKKYAEEGITLYTEESNGMYIVKNRETNKILKSVSYQKPNLKQILINKKIL